MNQLAKEIAQDNTDRGFWDELEEIETSETTYPGWVARTIIESKLGLIQSEIAEALEELRDGRTVHEVYYREDGKPEGFGMELADAVIRIFDLTGKLDIDLEGAIVEKIAFNRTRGYKHGRQF